MGLSPPPPSFRKSLKPSDLFSAPVLQVGRLRPRVYSSLVPALLWGGVDSKWLPAPCLHPRLAHAFGFEGIDSNWSASMQGCFQAAGIFVSLAMALVGGIIVGE